MLALLLAVACKGGERSQAETDAPTPPPDTDFVDDGLDSTLPVDTGVETGDPGASKRGTGETGL